jgi:hypothetical protein
MKKLLIPVTLLLLAGCGDTRSYALQDQFCAEKGGVYKYASDTGGFSNAWCNDNTKFTYDTVRDMKLRPEFYPKKEK